MLLWHKLVASTTGGLALCSAKHRLNRDEASNWARILRDVSDEIQEVLAGRPFILDGKGQRVVQSGSGGIPSPLFFAKDSVHDVEVERAGVNPAETIPDGPVRAQRAGPRIATKRKL